MPAPAMSSRHLYTGHRRGHIQAAPRLRAHRGEPLSQDHPQIPRCHVISFRSSSGSIAHQRDVTRSAHLDRWFGISACTATPEDLAQHGSCRAVVHTCSSSHRTPAPLTARRHPQRSPPRLLTDAACGGLESPPARRPRRTYLHHWHSTDRADDLLHHHHFPSGHTWVPETRPRSRDRAEPGGWSPPTHCCVSSGAVSSGTGPNHSDRRADHRPQRSFADSHCASQPTIQPGATAASTANLAGSATA